MHHRFQENIWHITFFLIVMVEKLVKKSLDKEENMSAIFMDLLKVFMP